MVPLVKDFTENDIILGHSLGSKAVLHLLEKTKKKIGHLYLIASAIGVREERDWEWFRKEWNGSDIDALKKFWHEKVNFENVRACVPHVTLVLSDDDPYVPTNTHRNLPADWQYKLWNGYGHFGMKEVPKLLELILQSKNTGVVPVPLSQLPVKLPDVKSYKPTGTGESPLAAITAWVTVRCPQCGGKAKRETNTMPQWAGSSWYHLRYMDPHNKKELVGKKTQQYWSPVDFYVGGAEHATRHLIYARFWHKFLNEIGVVDGSEPFSKLQHVGLIFGADGKKMSKRFGNVVNPNDIVGIYGADTFRMYEMFIGPFDQSADWSTKNIIGVRRFIERVWGLQRKVTKTVKGATYHRILTTTIDKVSTDIEAFKLNTAVSALMILVNAMDESDSIARVDYEALLKILSPFAPHIADELWNILGNPGSIYTQKWPMAKVADSIQAVTIAVQIDGKVRTIVELQKPGSAEAIRQILERNEVVMRWIAGKTIRRFIYIDGRLANFVLE